MGNTVTIVVNETWQEFFSIVGQSFTFSNQGPSEVYVRESATQPLAEDKSFVYMPSKGGGRKVESSPFWVRTKFGSSTFHFGTIIP